MPKKEAHDSLHPDIPREQPRLSSSVTITATYLSSSELT